MYETAKETLMYRTVLWTLWERERVGRFGLGLSIGGSPHPSSLGWGRTGRMVGRCGRLAALAGKALNRICFGSTRRGVWAPAASLSGGGPRH